MSAGPVQQVAETPNYKVQLNLDGTGLGPRTATIEVHRSNSQPLSDAQVVLMPMMRDMAMSSPKVTAEQRAPGQYQAQGEFFTMLGDWELDVQVRADGLDEIASFKVRATP
jgi:hypothetical protein